MRPPARPTHQSNPNFPFFPPYLELCHFLLPLPKGLKSNQILTSLPKETKQNWGVICCI